jgi:Arc/MetJ-type ribon-helix-helix transcriptional regulator
MPITLSPETQRLIEERMKQAGYSSPDELVRLALQTLDHVRGEDYEDLDAETRAAIDEAEAEYERGEGIPVDEAAARLRSKYFGK